MRIPRMKDWCSVTLPASTIPHFPNGVICINEDTPEQRPVSLLPLPQSMHSDEVNHQHQNAQLIKAAPNLLYACYQALMNPGFEHVHDLLLDVIEKATGTRVNMQNKSDKELWVCKKCGSDNVESLQWIDTNTLLHAPKEEIMPDEKDHFCNHCMQKTIPILLCDFKRSQQVKTDKQVKKDKKVKKDKQVKTDKKINKIDFAIICASEHQSHLCYKIDNVYVDVSMPMLTFKEGEDKFEVISIDPERQTKLYDYKGRKVRVVPNFYDNGFLAILVENSEDSEDYNVLTVNLEHVDAIGLPQNTFVDSNNEREALPFLVENGFVTETGYTRRSGFVDYPMVHANLALLYQHQPEIFQKINIPQNMARNKIYYAFGKPVPQEFIDDLLADDVPEEEITTEYIETLLEYERRDCENIGD